MANAFSKEEIVAFDSLLEGFNDALVMSRNVGKHTVDQTTMERTSDVQWIPQPYIAQSFDGEDQTANFSDYTQLSVPATIGYKKSVPWTMTALELRDAMQEGRLGDAAKQKLASDINRAVLDVAALQGTLVVTRTGAATGFDDVALCEAIMNETGVPDYDRVLALSTRDYNGMAANLASRTLDNSKSLTAYERAYIGRLASFDAYKLDYARRLTAAAGGGAITINTLANGGNIYVPKATSVAATGEVSNVDNRFQTVTLSSNANVAAGDCFTIDGVYNVHQITKQSTGQLKTFRVISVGAANTVVISPPLISALGGTDAEVQRQNCVDESPANNSAITFINYDTAAANPFWQKDAIKIIPGRYAVPGDAGAAVMRGTTDNGIEVVMQKQYDINTMKTKFRLDTYFGVVNLQPEQSGILLFSQTP